MADIQGVNLKELDSLFGSTIPAGDATPNKSEADKLPKSVEGVDLNSLDSMFGTPSSGAYKGANLGPLAPTSKAAAPKKDDDTFNFANPDLLKGAWQGLKDAPNTGASLIGYIDSKISDAGAKRNEDFKKRLEAEKATLPVDNTAFDIGRMGGQILSTGPLAAAATPEMAAIKAVPIVGKIGASIARGGVGGGIFGAATNSTNDDGLVNNIGTNAAYGAAAGPLLEAGGKLATKSISGISDIAEKIRLEKITRNTGIDPNAAKNTLARLTDAGHTPAQAEAMMQRMGPNATLADIDPSLATETGSLAAMGGKPTSILKNRYGERASNSNSAAHDIMETKLGSKPDYDAEKVTAKQVRQQLTSGDYNKAKASNMALDVAPVAQHIAGELKNAVGSEASKLHEIGSYLFDKAGNIKTDTAPLLKVRQAIDHDLKKMVKEGTTQESSTYQAVNEVRNQLDKVLKTNPDLAIADAKYAKLRQDFDGIDIGRKVISNTGDFDKFAAEFANASPEKQEYMRRGLRIEIGNLMDKATRGELSEAQRLFGKSSKNQKAIQLAFGKDGDAVLDALKKEAVYKSTEHGVAGNSLTAERRAVHERPEYGGKASEAGILGPIAQGAMADVVTGTPGAATAIGAGKGIISGIKNKISAERIEKTIEGSADLFSRQAKHGRSDAMDVLERINGVVRKNNRKLPVDYNGLIALATRSALPVGIETNKRLHALVDNFRGVRK